MKKRRIILLLINIYLFISTITVALIGVLKGTDAAYQGTEYGLGYLKTFTLNSNMLVAAAALVSLLLLIRELINGKFIEVRWVNLLYYVATAAVGVTFTTVVLFLAPISAVADTGRGFWFFYTEDMFFYHLLNPILAVIGLVLNEMTRKFTAKERILCIIPGFIYSIVYLVNVVFLKTWPDFYNFTFGGIYALVPVVMCGIYLMSYIIGLLLNKLWAHFNSPKLALTNAHILDGSKDMSVLDGKIIFIENGIITEIKDNDAAIPDDFYEVDLKGRYILPGLINLHVHLAGSGKPKNNSADAKKLVKLIRSNALTNAFGHRLVASYAKQELLSGTTTIRTVGGIADYDSRIRDKINAGKCIGPRILAANMAVSVPGGHMAGSLAYEAGNPKEACDYIDIIAKDEPDIIKLMITGGVSDAVKRGEPGVLRMSPDIVKAACERAHELGFKVAAHVESTEGVRVAVKNGVDSIEHGANPDSEIISLMKERGAFHVLTISPALPFAEFDRELMHITEIMQENGRIVFDGVVNMAKACLDNGIAVGLGTDTACPYVTQYDMWRELNYYMKYCGVSAKFAIYTATKLNASLAGVGDVTGSIEAGKSADMIVVDKNPLDDISSLRNVGELYFRGERILPRIKKIKVVEEKLDEYIDRNIPNSIEKNKL